MPTSEPDNNMQIDEIEEEWGKTDRNSDRIQCCIVVIQYLKEILKKGDDQGLMQKSLKEGHTPDNLKNYRGIIGEKISFYEGHIGSPQISPTKKEEYERKLKALELLRNKINIALKDSETPDDTPEGSGTDI
jgi:predicted transcriptional regulator